MQCVLTAELDILIAIKVTHASSERDEQKPIVVCARPS
jgi:hypothetical protein